MRHTEYLDMLFEAKSYKIVEVNKDHPHWSDSYNNFVGGTLTVGEKNFEAIGRTGTNLSTEAGAHGFYKRAYNELRSDGWLSNDGGKVLRVQMN